MAAPAVPVYRSFHTRTAFDATPQQRVPAPAALASDTVRQSVNIVQTPTTDDVWSAVLRTGSDEWCELQRELDQNNIDFIIVGSGFTGFAFASQILQKNPAARVVMLERGPLLLPITFKTFRCHSTCC